MLCVWDTQLRVQKGVKRLDGQATAITMGSTANHLAIGFKSGHWQIFSYNSMSLLHKNSDKSKTISVLKYSQESQGKQLLCVGSTDCEMLLYDAKNSYTKLGTLRAH